MAAGVRYQDGLVRLRTVCACCLVLCLCACGRGPLARTIHGEALGTFYTVTVVDPPATLAESALRERIDYALDHVDRLMSTYREDSELSRFNRHADPGPFPLSHETWGVFAIAQTISEQSGGAFDVTVGPLVNAWGFGPEVFENPPEDETVRRLLERTGHHLLTLHDDGAISKARPDLYCDLSGIAKGYAVDAVAEALEEAGVTRYMVEVGGEIRVAGKNPKDGAWILGIEAPKAGARDLHTVVALEQGALATSGDYRNMYEVDGRLVSHTIDPRTGYPAQHTLASVSVIHASCTWADGYATALMALGPEKAHALALELDLSVMLLVRDEDSDGFKVIATPQFDASRRALPIK